MKEIDKWADRIYTESDFGRSIATSIAGSIGLVIYLLTDDWVFAAFGTIISFPIFRLISSGLNDRYERRRIRISEKHKIENVFNQLSEEEKRVIESFVRAGGSVLTWNQINDENLSSAGIESLIQRELLWTSMTADCMKETFALDSKLFDISYQKMCTKISS